VIKTVAVGQTGVEKRVLRVCGYSTTITPKVKGLSQTCFRSGSFPAVNIFFLNGNWGGLNQTHLQKKETPSLCHQHLLRGRAGRTHGNVVDSENMGRTRFHRGLHLVSLYRPANLTLV
jgi:hypothetical protein